jgi:hypothetical protein
VRAYSYPGTALCPVCLGSGRISDRMPVADALADAETLRALMIDAEHASGRLSDVKLAQEAGNDAEAWSAYERDALAYVYASNAARAAFRAVPGLRGDR